MDGLKNIIIAYNSVRIESVVSVIAIVESLMMLKRYFLY